MRVLVISDTHGQINRVANVIFYNPDITHVIHLGDYTSDAEALLREFSDRQFYIIRGNNDFSPRYPTELTLNLCGKRIFATHGHMYHVKLGTQILLKHAMTEKADIVLFGHTHQKCNICINGIHLINPSSRGYYIIDSKGENFFGL